MQALIKHGSKYIEYTGKYSDFAGAYAKYGDAAFEAFDKYGDDALKYLGTVVVLEIIDLR
ncbi:MAG: hypothetical protein ACI4GD_03755 [Lachnospiraceae bacterium]